MGIIIASCEWPGRKGLRLSHEEMGQSHTHPNYSALTPGWRGTKAKQAVLGQGAVAERWQHRLGKSANWDSGESLHHAEQQRS